MIKEFFKENPRPTPTQVIQFINKQNNLYLLKTVSGNYFTTTFYDFILRQPNDNTFLRFEEAFNDTGYIGEIEIKSQYIVSYYKINQ